MILTVAQPLVRVFHPECDVLSPDSAVLDLEKENECQTCKLDFQPNEIGIVGHHTGAERVWHAVHEECLKKWCLGKVPPSTQMVPCGICSAPLRDL